MHSFLSRLNTLFAFTLTVLAVLTTGVFLSTYFEKYYSTVSIGVSKPVVKHMTDFSANRKKNDLGVLQLNLDTNLDPLFDWNVKQLFLYLIAEYVTPANSLNQVVLWDKIIRRGENARLNLHEIATKYYFWDDGDYLKSNNVTLTLGWNVISNAGRLIHVRGNGSTSFVFPAQYASSRLANSKSSGQDTIIIQRTFVHVKYLKCVPINPDDEIIDRQNDWKYQNSITGTWYRWGTTDEKQNHHIEWRVNWLNVAPVSYLGVIVYLTTRDELNSLHTSLAQLSHLLSNNPRPVVIFHEGDFNDTNIQKSLAKTLGDRTPLGFECIQFSNSSHQTRFIHRRLSHKYFHMCRFFTIMLPNHPLLTLFSLYWRLDSHSYIFGPKPIEDPFEIMQKRQIQYAFIMVNEEADHYATGLFGLFNEFLNEHCLKLSPSVRQTQITWFGRYSLAMIFTNFALANVSLFRDHSLIRAWLHMVDRNGGIYRERWGDAPIHTLILTQLISRNHIVRLRYFGYMHRQEYTCASGVQEDLCKQQVQPFLKNTTLRYYHYQDGCFPSNQNLLCHYYPEII
ncbi:unnamed protein product [Rotaria socialis]|uniref:Signal peptidase complex subunit 3 n=1 Tax=Rotaria socialis TaxID=392032 RepID=A0A817ZQ97_9BILA|nr:unnamed protein product [Rotaria socialis]